MQPMGLRELSGMCVLKLYCQVAHQHWVWEVTTLCVDLNA